MAPFPLPGQFTSFCSKDSDCDSVLKPHPYLFPLGGSGGCITTLIFTMLCSFTKSLHVIHSSELREYSCIHSFIHLPNICSARPHVIGRWVSPHTTGRVGRSLPGTGAENQNVGQLLAQNSFSKDLLGPNTSPSGGARPSMAARPGPPLCSQRSSHHLP